MTSFQQDANVIELRRPDYGPIELVSDEENPCSEQADIELGPGEHRRPEFGSAFVPGSYGSGFLPHKRPGPDDE